MTRNECLEILELPNNASEQDIVAAYRQLAQVWHPDRFPNNPALQQKANAKLAQINGAYDALRDKKFTPDSAPRKKAAVEGWFYSHDGKQLGPVSTATLRQLAKLGYISPSDLVRKQGHAEWLPASRLSRLLFETADDTEPFSPAPTQPIQKSRQARIPLYLAGGAFALIAIVCFLLSRSADTLKKTDTVAKTQDVAIEHPIGKIHRQNRRS